MPDRKLGLDLVDLRLLAARIPQPGWLNSSRAQGGQGLVGLDALEQRNQMCHSLGGGQAKLGSIAADGVG